MLTGGELKDGLLAPTVLASVSEDMRVCREEVFGPLAVVSTYASLTDGIALSNQSDFGLQAGIFTTDLQKAFRAARELDFGGVIVNDSPSWRVDQMPYGGVKASGVGKEGPEAAVREMTVQRLVVMDVG